MQLNQWSLEDLELYLDIDGDKLHESRSFDTTVHGLVLQGAAWAQGEQRLVFSDDLRFSVPVSKLKWRLKSHTETQSNAHATSIPMYINENRKQLVSQVFVSTSAEIAGVHWAQRSVAFVLQSPIV